MLLNLIECSFKQAKWYYYILLGLVDVEANFLGELLLTPFSKIDEFKLLEIHNPYECFLHPISR